jgi:DNA/RNA-binding domain of Phe-tRNA-synthetase-like protein
MRSFPLERERGCASAEPMLSVDPHPLLELGAFESELPRPLGELPSPEWLLGLLAAEAAAPLAPSEAIRKHVRDLLRHGGYKPTGRGKPASEYLGQAAAQGRLGSINAAVDVCNVVSLHSGLPVSLVDLARAEPPLRIGLVEGDVRYVFNAAGQEIRVEGLLCLFDRHGPCANGVKDSERTKTRADTVRTLSVVWGAKALGEHTARAVAWYRELCERLGARTARIGVQSA